MRRAFYKDFSFKAHKINRAKNIPNASHFELTFGCDLHCRYCYSDCYNKPNLIRKELNTQEIKLILDKLYNAGVIWLCLSGGDPLSRPDFLEIYAYAKKKGFLIIIFTNGVSLTKEISGYLAKFPPFNIEMTLNASNKRVYERISRVPGSFEKALNGIKLARKAKLPLKIKTLVTRDNLAQLRQTKNFIRKLGLKFYSNALLHASLDNSIVLADLRITPAQFRKLYSNSNIFEDCKASIFPARQFLQNNRLFNCVVSAGDSIHIDPYGNIVPCMCIRQPKINLKFAKICQAREKILAWLRSRKFKDNDQCRSCEKREACFSCPGKAWLETKSLGEKVGWFCELANLKP